MNLQKSIQYSCRHLGLIRYHYPGTRFGKNVCLSLQFNCHSVYSSNSYDISNFSRYLDKDSWTIEAQEKDTNYWYKELEFINDENFYDLISPKLYRQSQDDIILQLANCVNIEKIIFILKNNEVHLNKQHAIQTICRLSMIKAMAEQNLINLKQHGQGMSDYNTQNCFERLISFPEFHSIVLTIIEKNLKILSSEEVAAIMSCLNYLGIPTYNDLMISLHICTLYMMPKMSSHSLVQLSFLFRSKGLKSYDTQVKIMNNIYPKMSSSMSLDELRNISLALINLKKYWCEKALISFLDIIKELIKNKRIYNATPSTKISLLKAIYSTPKEWINIKDYAVVILNTLEDDISSLTPGQIFFVNRSILYQYEPRGLFLKLKEHTSCIFDDYKDLELQVELLRCLTSHSSFKIKRNYEEFTLNYMMQLCQKQQNYVSINRIFKLLKSVDYDLQKILWIQLIDKGQLKFSLPCQQHNSEFSFSKESEANQISMYYYNYLFLNAQLGMNHRIKEIEKWFISTIEEELLTFNRLIPTKIANMLSLTLMFTHENKECTTILYEKLERNSNQLTYYDIKNLSKSIQLYIRQRLYKQTDPVVVAKICHILNNVTFKLLEVSLFIKKSCI